MDLLKAMGFAAVITGCLSLVIGSQGTSAGQLAIHSMELCDLKIYWSWPVFLAGTGLFWGILLLQR